MNVFSQLIPEVRDKVNADAIAAGWVGDVKNQFGNGASASDYADAIATYLAFALSRSCDWNNSLSRWESKAQVPQQLFGRQAISMVWDYSEANPMSSSTGSFMASIENLAKSFSKSSAGFISAGRAIQADAMTQTVSEGKCISTDPPYYDNIGYADLSDFFYVWLRRSLRSIYPDLFATVTVPKAEELVASCVAQTWRWLRSPPNGGIRYKYFSNSKRSAPSWDSTLNLACISKT